jgi:hypothetical protein
VGSWYPKPSSFEPFDKYRCAEVDGEGDRCQLVVGQRGEHVLQRAGQRVTWPVGAEPHTRPPWAVTFARDESET